MAAMVLLLSTEVKRDNDLWRVSLSADDDRTAFNGPQSYDPATESLVWDAHLPVLIACDRGRGFRVLITAWQLTTWHHGPGSDGEPKLQREPYRLTIDRVTL